MGDASSVLKNTAFAAAGRISQPVCSVVLAMILLARLDPLGWGSYSTAINAYFIFQLISSAGLKTLITREVSRTGEFWREVGSGMTIAFPFSLVVCATAIAFIQTGNMAEQTKTAAMIFVAIIPVAAAIDILEGGLNGLSRFRFLAVSTTLENIVRVTLSVWVVLALFPGDPGEKLTAENSASAVMKVTCVFSVARLAQLIALGLFSVTVRGRPPFRIDWSHVRSLAITVRPFFLAMLAVSLFWRVGFLILQRTHGEVEVGNYDAVFRFVNVLILALQALIAVVFPMLCKRFVQNPDAVSPLASSTIKNAVLAVIPACLGIALITPMILERFGYNDAIPLVFVLAWVPLPYAISVIQAHVLLATSKQRADLVCNVVATTGLILASSILIPLYGAAGYAWSLLIGSICLNFVQMRYVHLRPKEVFAGWRPLSISVGLSLVFVIAFLPDWNPLLRLTGALMAYGAALAIICPFNAKELTAIKSFTRKRLHRGDLV